MSDEMAVGDNATSDENKVNRDETAAEDVGGAGEATPQPVDEPPIVTEEAKASVEDKPETESLDDNDKLNTEVKEEIEETTPEVDEQDGENRGTKRRASIAFSEAGDEEFKGFEESKDADLSKEYSRVLERLEAEVQTAIKDLKPIKSLKATISPIKASKRPRQDTDGSRPSSALSTRSDGEWSEQAGASPGMRGRRSTTEMSSPLLRVPLERGWRRELVYRAALDAHSRRNADIYYYTPQGKKLRSSREVAENLAGTGLTLENFSFFKEPLGVDDPEKEIIRDAKLMRRVESPVPATQPALEGKRTPKPKPPKGASPEPTTPKSPPAKLKVKSLGSRLSNNGTPPVASAPKQSRRLQAAVAATATAATATPTAATIATATATAATLPAAPDNNNTAAWKKPRAAAATQPPQPPPQPQPHNAPQPHAAPQPPQSPPPLQSRPQQPRTDAVVEQSVRRVVQPCSMACGRGAVPSLACVACLCLYHPACAGLPHGQPSPSNFLCKNCRKSTSPPLEPPPLTHKSGATVTPSAAAEGGAGGVAPVRRPPANIPSPLPVPAKVRPDKRVLLRMKVAGGKEDGTRVWAVAPTSSGPGTPPPGVRPTLPQSLAVLNGRRFIVVPRSLVHTEPH